MDDRQKSQHPAIPSRGLAETKRALFRNLGILIPDQTKKIVRSEREEKEQRIAEAVVHSSSASDRMTTTYRLLPALQDTVALDNACQFLQSLSRLQLTELKSEFTVVQPNTFVFSLNGSADEIYFALAVPSSLAAGQLEQLALSFYPNLQLEEQAHDSAAAPTTAEYRSTDLYGRKFRSFTDFNPDPLGLFCSALERLNPGELASLRIEFTPAPLPRPETDLYNTKVPQPLLSLQDKTIKQLPLWIVGIKLAVEAPTPERQQQILEALAQHLALFGPVVRDAWTLRLEEKFLQSAVNRLDYFKYSYIDRYLKKGSTGGGFLWQDVRWPDVINDLSEQLPRPLWKYNFLNNEELAGLVHLPHKSLQSPILLRANMQTKKAPDEMTQSKGLLVGSNDWRKQSKEVRLPHHLRSRHTYIVGASGSGKSNLLKNCIRQDIEDGRGLCVIDPHGDLVSDVLPFIPESRLADVIIFNPCDRDFPVSINPFVPTTDDNRNDVALTFKTTFIRMFNVSDEARRMLNLLHFCTLALLEAGQKTFLDIRKFLINPDFRRGVLKSINDPTVLEFWYEEFPSTYPKASVAPISTRLAQFALSPVTRNILGQKQQAFDLYDVMNSGKILLCPLGKIQEEERQLLGSLLVSQLQLATMRRAELPEGDRRLFPLYIDEFQNFASDAESLEKILSEARKYNLALILAHQFTSQLPTKLADAIIANAYTKIIFRVGLDDARYLEKALSGYTAEDLQNQKIGQAVICAGRAQDSFNLGTFKFPDPPANNQAQAILEHSRQTYGIPRAAVEALLRPPAPPPEEEEPAAKPEPAIAAEAEPAAPARPRKPSKTKAAKAPEANIFDELLNSD